ncbi:MAG TPA: ferritin-like protein [Isosphaeraceae bacterium]|jgi:hypothetical protein|nr:ferritin-like protein [Isosphaeraceae bacterium]
MIVLESRLFEDLGRGDKPAVIEALRAAIRLEHATIPPYLYALYSLDPARNADVAGLLRSVVREEMLHMALACNVLNALGADPELDRREFLCPYPGPLPGGVEGQLTVHLAPFSADQLEAFLTIESPRKPIDIPVLARTWDMAAEAPPTIGEFYGEIKAKIADLGDAALSKEPRHQVGPELLRGAVVVTDVATVRRAIEVIVEQGEGTAQSPLAAAQSNRFAHFYRFMEIKKGGRLVVNPDAPPDAPPEEKYAYDRNQPIAFDPEGVYPVPTDPSSAAYPAGGAARNACDRFNSTYTDLLKVLQATFTGEHGRFRAAIGLMMSLKQQAQAMMSGSSPVGIHVGPSFEWRPIL